MTRLTSCVALGFFAATALIRLTHNKWEEGVSSWEAPLK
jgi:hypothetical protein